MSMDPVDHLWIMSSGLPARKPWKNGVPTEFMDPQVSSAGAGEGATAGDVTSADQPRDPSQDGGGTPRNPGDLQQGPPGGAGITGHAPK
jgi:hypothetical protein